MWFLKAFFVKSMEFEKMYELVKLRYDIANAKMVRC